MCGSPIVEGQVPSEGERIRDGPGHGSPGNGHSPVVRLRAHFRQRHSPNRTASANPWSGYFPIRRVRPHSGSRHLLNRLLLQISESATSRSFWSEPMVETGTPRMDRPLQDAESTAPATSTGSASGSSRAHCARQPAARKRLRGLRTGAERGGGAGSGGVRRRAAARAARRPRPSAARGGKQRAGVKARARGIPRGPRRANEREKRGGGQGRQGRAHPGRVQALPRPPCSRSNSEPSCRASHSARSARSNRPRSTHRQAPGRR